MADLAPLLERITGLLKNRSADPGKVHLLSPAEIEPALKAGRDRAIGEADRIKAFWA